MNPQRYQQIKGIFMEAFPLPEQERDAFLDRACGDDQDLRCELDELFRHHNPATFIDAAGAEDACQQDRTLDLGPESPAAAEYAAGTVLADRYRIVGLLGRGGMGCVYRADDLRLAQMVALKFLPPERAANPAWRNRFVQEVSIARRVTHPNVCRVHDICETEGQVFLSMEYIDGEDLASLLRRIGRLPADKALDIARQVCMGLAAAHDQDVLHRDLKPANIMLDGRGMAHITDFGIAALRPRPGQPTGLAGTPAYTAPEVIRGEPASKRGDIYGLGLVLYEMVTGRPVFGSSTLEERSGQQTPPVPAQPSSLVADLDPAFERIILQCIDQDPARRPPSALAVAAALPGGDPLAVALAAGHTPSPETVAAAGTEGIRPVRAAVLLAASLAALLGVLLLADHSLLLSDAQLPRAPAVLEEKAREIIRTLARTDQTRGAPYGFVVLPGTAGNDGSGPERLVFEFRQGERWVPPYGPLDVPRLFQVPWAAAGSRMVHLDPQGRLVTYMGLPERMPGGSVAPAPDWSVPFQLAGLDPAAFSADTAGPPGPNAGAEAADAVRAWRGAGPDGEALQVVGAALGPAILWFQVSPAAGGPAGSSADFRAGGPAGLAVAARYLLFWTVLIGGGVLAWRNLRSRRGDQRGAWRIALLMMAVDGLLWMVRNRHDLGAEAALLVMALRSAVFLGAATWILYVGLEPQVRRFWPQSIIGWSRALLGRLADPQVAGHVLIGLLAGIATVLVQQVGVLIERAAEGAGHAYLLPPASAELGSLVGFLALIDRICSSLSIAVLAAMGFLLLLLLFRLALRRAWLAATCFVIVGTCLLAMVFGSTDPLSWLSHAVTVLVLTVVLQQVGLLAAVAAVFASQFLLSSPLSVHLDSWYAEATGTTLALLCGLLLAALVGSVRPRPAPHAAG